MKHPGRFFGPIQWRLRHRLAASHAFLVMLLLALGVHGTHVTQRLAAALSTTADVSLARLQDADRVTLQVQTIATAARDLLLLDEAKQIRRQKELIAEALRDVEALSPAFEAAKDGQDVRSLRERFEAALNAFLHSIENGDPEDARAALVVRVRPAQKAYQERLLLLARQEFDNAIGVAHEGEASAEKALWLSLTLVAFAVVLGSLAAAWLTRSIVQPARLAREAALAIGDGNLDHPIAPGGGDEVGEMIDGLRKAQESLRSVIDGVHQASDTVAHDAAQILDSNRLLADRNARSGVRLQETAASIEEITRTLASSSDMALSAATLTQQARDAAHAGGESVLGLVTTMQQISASSDKIRDIIGVIDGLSFQTNLLALNAAVEAARAGDHGKGFAVVAAEVRALASRSAHAANEVRSLIEHSAEQVSLGNARVIEAGTRIEAVVARVNDMSHHIGEISRSSAEQAASVRVVNEAMCDLDRTTQENASFATELSGAASGLNGSATRLLESVRYFKRAAGQPHRDLAV